MKTNHVPSIDRTFDAHYTVEFAVDLPSKDVVRRIPEGLTTGSDGLILQIEHDSETFWIGMFAARGETFRALNRVHTCPNPMSLCVISGGLAYMGRVDAPESFGRVAPQCVADSVASAGAGLLFLISATSIHAYDEHGKRWDCLDVSSDGIRSVAVEESLTGEAWEAALSKWVPFRVRLSDGGLETDAE